MTLALLYIAQHVQTLIRPTSGASEYLLCCVGWLEACWCYVAGLSVGAVVSEFRLNHYSNIKMMLGPIRIRCPSISSLLVTLSLSKLHWEIFGKKCESTSDKLHFSLYTFTVVGTSHNMWHLHSLYAHRTLQRTVRCLACHSSVMKKIVVT